jgi:hypothetical protein
MVGRRGRARTAVWGDVGRGCREKRTEPDNTASGSGLRQQPVVAKWKEHSMVEVYVNHLESKEHSREDMVEV